MELLGFKHKRITTDLIPDAGKCCWRNLSTCEQQVPILQLSYQTAKLIKDCHEEMTADIFKYLFLNRFMNYLEAVSIIIICNSNYFRY
jgi:hypothetical protein